MNKYPVIFFRGDYGDRQEAANKARVNLYFEQHFNSCGSLKPGYPAAIVARNASDASKIWAREYVLLVAQAFGLSVSDWDKMGFHGVKIGGFGGRGNYNLTHTNMPAILGEPLFASNPEQAKIIVSEEGRRTLAECLAESIRWIRPAGASVGFSVGHKYKASRPFDRGAGIVGFPGTSEADEAEKVLLLAKELLEGRSAPLHKPEPDVPHALCGVCEGSGFQGSVSCSNCLGIGYLIQAKDAPELALLLRVEHDGFLGADVGGSGSGSFGVLSPKAVEDAVARVRNSLTEYYRDNVLPSQESFRDKVK